MSEERECRQSDVEGIWEEGEASGRECVVGRENWM